MATVKILTGLLLLGCLVSAVTSSPIKGKDNPNTSHPSRFMRIKTVTRVTQIPQSALSSNGMIYPNQSPEVQFGSSLSSPSVAFGAQSQIAQRKGNGYISSQSGNQEVSHLADDRTKHDHHDVQGPEALHKQSLSSPGTHSHLPAITNFGERIQKNDQNSKQLGCRVKGTCSTMNFTPNEQISAEGVKKVENTLVRDSHITSGLSYDQRQFTAQDQPQKQETFESGQNNDSEYHDKNNVNSQDEEEHKRPQDFGQGENTGIINNQGSVQTSFQPEAQFTSQQDSSDYSNGQNYEGQFQTQENDTFTGHNRQSTSISVLPVEQTSADSRVSYEDQRNFAGNSQFDQSVSQDSFNNVREPQISGVQSGSFASEHQNSDDGQYHQYADPIEGLRYNVPGNPGEDYPILYQVPQTSFNCKDQPFSAGIFGDTEASCQVFHVCKENGGQASFLCPNGTVFNQQYFVCDWWYNFRCSETPSFYNLNNDLYWDWDSFTPSQMLNVPSGDTENPYSNLQRDTQVSFGSNEGIRPGTGEIGNQRDTSTFTTAVDNSAIREGNQNMYEQKSEDAFTQEEPTPPSTGSVFQSMDQGIYEQHTNEDYPSSLTSDVGVPTRGLDLATISPISDGRVENIPEFTRNVNDQTDNSFYPISSDTGSNREQGGDSGTRYPDKNGQSSGPQYDTNIQSLDQNRPLLDSQRNLGNSNPSEKVSEEKYVQKIISSDFRGPISGSVQNNQNNYGTGADEVVRSNNKQILSDNNDRNYLTQTRVQDERLPNSSDRDKDQEFNPSSNNNIQRNQGSFNTQDQRPLFDNNQQVNINQHQQVGEGEYSSSFGNNPDFSGKRDESYNQQISQNQGFPFGVNQQRDGHNSDNRNEDDANNFSNVQQEHISDAFGVTAPDSFQNGNSGSFGPQSQNTFTQGDISTSFEGGIDKNFGNSERFGPQSQNTFTQGDISTSFEGGIDKNFGNSESFGPQSQNTFTQGVISTSFEGGIDKNFGNSESFGPQSQNTFTQGDISTSFEGGIDKNFGNSESFSPQSQNTFTQDHISTSFEAGTDKNFGNSESFGPQSQNTFTQGHISTSFEGGVDENLGNSRSNAGTNNQQNQGVQQEHISSSFDDQRKDSTSGEDYDTSKAFENGQREDSRGFTSPEGVSPNDGNYNTQKVDGNKHLQQDHTSSFSGNSRDSVFRVMDNRGEYGNSQTRGKEFSEAHNALNSANKNNGNQNVDTPQEVQQEVTSWNNNSPNNFNSRENTGSERNINNQRQTISSLQPNNQNLFNNNGGQQFQHTVGNQDIRQEHVSVSLNGFRQNAVGSVGSNINNNLQEEVLTTLNRGNTAHGNNQHVSFGSRDSVDRNNPQVTEQKHISNHFGQNQPTDYEMNKNVAENPRPNFVGSEIGSTNSFTNVNENIQQQSVSIPFDGNARDAFYPGNNRGQNGFVQDQINSPVVSTVQNNNDREQSYGSVQTEQNPKIEDQQRESPVISGENIEYQKTENNQGNSQNNFGNADFALDRNTGSIPEVQQEYIISTFNGPHPNVFNSPGNDRNYNGYVNIPRPDQQNGQNNFGVDINNQQTFPVVINLQQENIPGSFENNHQTNFHRVSSFEQEKRKENLSQQNQFVSSGGSQNSFGAGTNGVQLNPNEVFQMRLNNFRPMQIHMMNRGGIQNGNYEQQRLSFRPYGQNNQNVVIFPGGNNPANFAQNPSLGVKSAFSNERSPSNRNFFVTNGHQLREEHSQLQTGNRPHLNEGPANNIQADNREYGPQNIKRTSQDEFNSAPGAVDRKNEDAAIQKSDVIQTASTPSRVGNQNVNSGIKGSSSQNYRSGKNVNISPSSNAGINPRGSPDAVTYNSPMPESPTSMNYNGWKPVVKY